MQKLKKNTLSDAWTLLLIKKFIAKLNYIVTVAVNYEVVDVKSDIKNELTSHNVDGLVISNFFSLKFTKPTHHMFHNAHSVFIQSKCH